MTSEAMTTPAHKTGRTRPRNKLGLMVNRAIRPESVPVLVDLGYLEDKKSRDCADRLMASGLVPKKAFSIEGHRRLLVTLPPKRAEQIIKRFRFVSGSTYWQCTHSRAALSASRTTGDQP